MRFASPMRVYFPTESSSTMISDRVANFACMTRQRPAALMKPVLERPISQFPPRTSPFVFTNATRRPRIV